jgi:hypothetical protein
MQRALHAKGHSASTKTACIRAANDGEYLQQVFVMIIRTDHRSDGIETVALQPKE